MLGKNTILGLVAGFAALCGAVGLAPLPAAADEARVNVAPAVYRTANGDGGGATTQFARYRGYYGWGWRGAYRPYYGYRYGYYRPYRVRPFYGANYGYGPAYGYGYGYAGYGYGGYGGRCCR